MDASCILLYSLYTQRFNKLCNRYESLPKQKPMRNDSYLFPIAWGVTAVAMQKKS